MGNLGVRLRRAGAIGQLAEPLVVLRNPQSRVGIFKGWRKQRDFVEQFNALLPSATLAQAILKQVVEQRHTQGGRRAGGQRTHRARPTPLGIVDARGLRKQHAFEPFAHIGGQRKRRACSRSASGARLLRAVSSRSLQVPQPNRTFGISLHAVQPNGRVAGRQIAERF